MSDWGFPPLSLFGMGLQKGYGYAPGDHYNPYDPYYGNSNIKGACDNGVDQLGGDGSGIYGQFNYAPDWIYTGDTHTDLRMVYVQCARNNGVLTGGVSPTTTWGTCSFTQISSQTHLPICFTPESIKYTQTSFFFGFIVGQMGNLLCHKGRRSSIYFQGFSNYYQLWGLASEVVLALLFAYIPGLNYGIGTRDVSFLHYGFPAAPFSLFIMFYDEMRKILVNISAKVQEGEKPGWWARNYAY